MLSSSNNIDISWFCIVTVPFPVWKMLSHSSHNALHKYSVNLCIFVHREKQGKLIELTGHSLCKQCKVNNDCVEKLMKMYVYRNNTTTIPLMTKLNKASVFTCKSMKWIQKQFGSWIKLGLHNHFLQKRIKSSIKYLLK